MEHEVFINYSTQDKVIADAVCHSLEENNIPCWVAPREEEYGIFIGTNVNLINDRYPRTIMRDGSEVIPSNWKLEKHMLCNDGWKSCKDHKKRCALLNNHSIIGK